ncbi:hypothetical protein AXF42_Ash020557 [Apostasia shenzhenica]|uniref:MAGE domain-containing protein n=1 Tax=Apostasia shenzhenica TaxID=1088818 RepID=A0A2I0BCW9_9ASPA|nr:hypothetical protein AXF42_Ash020557 [Apostasia shenzhenica]
MFLSSAFVSSDPTGKGELLVGFRCVDWNLYSGKASKSVFSVALLGVFVKEQAKLVLFWMASHEELSQINISKEEKDKLVAEVIRYVLFKTHQGFGCPIKREELTQLITKTYRQRSLPALVINEAREKISTVFGYEMKELQRSRASGTRQNCASQQSAAEAKSYVLVSQLPSDIYKKYIEDKGASHIYGFTFVVISIVYLAGGKLSEENLWHHLRRLGLSVSDESHPVFGSTKQKLDLLVQQRFLQKEIANDAGGKVVMYELAERALEESVNDKLKDYIAQVHCLAL